MISRRVLLPLILVVAPIASAQPAEDVPRVLFSHYRTANGMQVVLSPDKSLPTVSVGITYELGSRNESPGRTGVANLLHALSLQDLQRRCKETLLIADADLDEACRGSINQERTSYSLSVPADRWEAALSLLAEPMRGLDVDQVRLDSHRAAILDERAGEDASARAAERLLDLSFTSFAYRHGVKGSTADLKSLTVADVQRVFRTYIVPDNAALALAGSFDEAEARSAIEKHFGAIRRGGPIPPVKAAEKAPARERREVLMDATATHPQYLASYKTVPSDHPDWYALNLLADILGQGETSRLHRALVETRLALDIAEGMSESREPSLFRVRANLPPDGDVKRVEAVIDGAIERIQHEGVTEAELALARSQERDYWKRLLATPRGRAETLARVSVYFRDPDRINGELKAILGKTAQDVQRVARKYLRQDRRAVVITLPSGR